MPEKQTQLANQDVARLCGKDCGKYEDLSGKTRRGLGQNFKKFIQFLSSADLVRKKLVGLWENWGKICTVFGGILQRKWGSFAEFAQITTNTTNYINIKKTNTKFLLFVGGATSSRVCWI